MDHKLFGPMKVHFFNLDIATQTASAGPRFRLKFQTEHMQKVEMIRNFVAEHIDCEYHEHAFDEESEPGDVIKYFKDRFKDIAKDDQVIIYYHGNSGWNGKQWRWKFENYPKGDINAYDLVQFFMDSGVHVLLLLDANTPDRFRNKWENIEGLGRVEFLVRGGQLTDSDGDKVENDSGDFTIRFCDDIDDFINKIDEPTKEGGYRGWSAPITIPQLLAKSKQISFNPKRIWTGKPRATDYRDLFRSCISPDDIRLNHRAGVEKKLRFFTKQVQGDGVSKKRKREEEHQPQPPPPQTVEVGTSDSGIRPNPLAWLSLWNRDEGYDSPSPSAFEK